MLYNNNDKIIDFENDVLKSESDLEIKRVDQGKYVDQISRRKGICAGLSVVHILTQLSSNKGEVINPFDNEDLLRKSCEIQDLGDEGSAPGLFIWKNHVEEMLPVERKPYKSEFNFADQCHDDDCKIKCNDEFNNTFNNKLKSKISKTINDKKGRGVYIDAVIYKNPSNQNEMRGRHAISMTTQIYQDYLYCTGMDSNFFFATAKGETGCNKLANKMTETLKAYETDHYNTFTAQLKK